MERLVVLRPEHADLSREFSSSFVLRDLVDLTKRVANSWRRMAVRVPQSQSCSCAGGMHRYFSPAFPHSPSQTAVDRCRRLAAGKLQRDRNRILTPRGDGCAKLRLFGTSH